MGVDVGHSARMQRCGRIAQLESHFRLVSFFYCSRGHSQQFMLSWVHFLSANTYTLRSST
ncbi:hypothetical protein BAUCODRAFT_435851 [Baudoinia panamericana UAMH 10762]|uniref:Uncharacterized protein n=1 Tax=Baudoinia panamericana (strain UAMH 10762) TaxID=717646 RepID=M2MK13_BAUPA|nr:uncharacterized protein BAUCODRAFT_435851 [Baudoinia panamericana UAMH 10762]EMC97026.1 hypothetical protein BAUCODRAFT_435851 [Baudoinia panamericana UAMH 10762]